MSGRKPRPANGIYAVGAIFAIAGAFTGALAATQTRSLTRYRAGGDDRRLLLALHGALLAGHGALRLGSCPTPRDAVALVAAGIFGGLGQVFLTQSYRFGDASLIAPFDYTSMLWALDRQPARLRHLAEPRSCSIGTAIVIAAGLFVIYREHRLGIERTRSKRAQTPTTPLS